jgi:hypothetical protein
MKKIFLFFIATILIAAAAFSAYFVWDRILILEYAPKYSAAALYCSSDENTGAEIKFKFSPSARENEKYPFMKCRNFPKKERPGSSFAMFPP